ncbi:MAG: hypothetical protein IH805_10565, partial [Proteobacteria bacterium]|nr:hypothetical protein [Pseudomonadota bacterium]
MRILVREQRVGAFASRAVAITVPSFAPDEPTVLPPFFPEPRGKWLLTRESEGGQKRPFPFMIRDQPFLPAALPEVPSNSESRVCLIVYNLGDGPVSITTEVLDGMGSVHEEPR